MLVEWPRSRRRRTFGFTRTGCLRTATIPSRWKSESRTACTSSSSTTSRNKYQIPIFYLASMKERRMARRKEQTRGRVEAGLTLDAFSSPSLSSTQIPPQGRHRRKDLLPLSSHQDQAYGAVHHPEGNDGSTTESVQRERDHHQVRGSSFSHTLLLSHSH